MLQAAGSGFAAAGREFVRGLHSGPAMPSNVPPNEFDGKHRKPVETGYVNASTRWQLVFRIRPRIRSGTVVGAGYAIECAAE